MPHSLCRAWLHQCVGFFVMSWAKPNHIKRTVVVRVMPVWLIYTLRHGANRPRHKPPSPYRIADKDVCFAALRVLCHPTACRGGVALGIGWRLSVFRTGCNTVRHGAAQSVIGSNTLKVFLTMGSRRRLDAFLALGFIAEVEALSGPLLRTVFAVHDQKGISESKSSNPGARGDGAIAPDDPPCFAAFAGRWCIRATILASCSGAVLRSRISLAVNSVSA